MDDLGPLAGESFCYVTTKGRRSNQPHQIEIWFGWERGMTIYLLAGGRDAADWVRNIRAEPVVSVRIGKTSLQGTGRVVLDEEEDALARRLLAAKYQGWQEGEPFSGWAESALPVAIDLRS